VGRRPDQGRPGQANPLRCPWLVREFPVASGVGRRRPGQFPDPGPEEEAADGSSALDSESPEPRSGGDGHAGPETPGPGAARRAECQRGKDRDLIHLIQVGKVFRAQCAEFVSCEGKLGANRQRKPGRGRGCGGSREHRRSEGCDNQPDTQARAPAG